VSTILSGRGDHEAPRAGAEQIDAERKGRNRFRMANDPINRLYARARWKKFRAVMLGLNPICCRLKKNDRGEREQCDEASVIVHHRISPRVNEALFLVPSNVTCYCRACHPESEGDPIGWVLGVDFTPTVEPKWTF